MLVIVSGISATGKTTIGRTVATRLGYEFCSKDMFKEQLFAQYRRSKLLWWRWYDGEAKRQFFERLVRDLRAGKSVIAESNFEPSDRQKLAASLPKQDIIELYFYAKPSVVLKRYVRRLRTSEKHPGHYDWLWTPVLAFHAFAPKLGFAYYRPTGLTDLVLRIDTSDFRQVSIDEIARWAKKEQAGLNGID